MQTLKLANDLFPALLSGQKTATVRAGTRQINLGELCIESVTPKDGGFIRAYVDVHEVRYKPVRLLSDSEAKADGCETADELKKLLLRFYPGLKESDEVTVVLFTITGSGTHDS